MKRGLLAVFFVVFVLGMSVASAGIFDFLKPSGKASSAPQNVSVTIAGANPPIVNFVEDLTSINPNEYNTRTVFFYTQVYDADGVNNINDSSVDTQLTFGATTRTGSCTYQSDLDGFTANYSCSVILNYYDTAGTWTVNVSALDIESNYAENTSEQFSYALLKAFAVPLVPSALGWSTLIPGASNQNASNDPTVVNNTGNYNGNIFLNATDLTGETTPSENISASEFSVAGVSGSECSGISLGPDNALTDTSISANSGPPGSNLANIYYCISSVPFVSSQTYSTNARGQSWILTYN